MKQVREICFLLLAWISPLILFMELQHKQCVPVKEGSDSKLSGVFKLHLRFTLFQRQIKKNK